MRWAVVAVVLLAGCADAPEPVVVPDVVTDPTDLDYEPGSHVHDYWDGRESVLVVQNRTGDRNLQYGSDRGTAASWVPPDGSIVPQGTGAIEATVDWRPSASTVPPGLPNEFTRAELWVRTASDSEPWLAGPVEKGQAMRFNITQEHADPPHYVLSLWEFSVVLVNEGGSSMSFSGSLSLEAHAFRTLPLQVFPPHPDLWQGAEEKELANQEVLVTAHAGLPGTHACIGGCADLTFRPYDDAVVPHDASYVEVTVTTDTASTPLPFGLEAHGADTRTMHAVAPVEDEIGRRAFRIDLEPGMGDSPYAKQSLWEFHVFIDTPQSLGPWTGSYEVTAKAVR